jgi:hypothetical protein
MFWCVRRAPDQAQCHSRLPAYCAIISDALLPPPEATTAPTGPSCGIPFRHNALCGCLPAIPRQPWRLQRRHCMKKPASCRAVHRALTVLLRFQMVRRPQCTRTSTRSGPARRISCQPNPPPRPPRADAALLSRSSTIIPPPVQTPALPLALLTGMNNPPQVQTARRPLSVGRIA